MINNFSLEEADPRMPRIKTRFIPEAEGPMLPERAGPPAEVRGGYGPTSLRLQTEEQEAREIRLPRVVA